MARRRLTDTEIAAQVRAARRRKPDPGEPRVKRALYSSRHQTLSLRLTSGVSAELPIGLLTALRDVPDDVRHQVTVSPGGWALRWDALDLDYDVSGLLVAALWPKPRAAMRVMGQAGGRVRSEAKVRAARANGAKGGRPRKTA